ncbi:MAG: hypothetical protein PHQ60_10410 [Sideroxydans sp.]|nr:hypothetical protein [Sideroxydans sp.]
MNQSLANMAARLNSAHITIDDLLFVTEEVHKLPPEDRDWEGRLHLTVRLFKGEPDKALAIEKRLVAMSALIDSGSLPHWALPEAPDGSVKIAEPVWIAAATEPLLLTERDTYFEPTSFLERVLSLAEPDGNA